MNQTPSLQTRLQFSRLVRCSPKRSSGSTAFSPTLHVTAPADAASSSSDGDEDTSSETGSDDSGGEECSSASGDLSEDEEPSSDHADDTSAGEGSQDAPGGLQQSCPVPDSNTAASAQHHAPHLSTHAAGTSKIPSAAQDMASQQQAQLSTPSGTTAAGAELDSSTDTNGPQQAAAVPWPVVDAIQLAPGSCSLTHNEHAHLRQQLLASLEADKEAAALQQALADDPLLSLSLS